MAASCALAPLSFDAVRAVYVVLARGADPAQPWVIALQVALGSGLLLVPTLLMGATLPLLTRHLDDDTARFGRVVAALYAANTLGAAMGAFVTGYFLLAALGVLRTTLFAAALNVLVATGAIVWHRRARGVDTPASEGHEGRVAPRRSAAVGEKAVGWAVLAVGGAVTLALEGVSTHLLAVVVGNSAYAFAAMLVCFLLGLGLGSPLGRARLARGRPVARGLASAQAMLGLAMLGGVFVWSLVPQLFVLVGGTSLPLGFTGREAVRLAVCAVLLVPPALFIGASYPLAIEAVAGSATDRVGTLGRAAAVNTLGNVAGALGGSFLLLPNLGSLRELQFLGVSSLLLAALACKVTEASARKGPLFLLVAGVVALAAQPTRFDVTSLSSGSNVYFRAQGFGAVVDYAESANGGLTAVAVEPQDDGPAVKTLLTNGKFQGNDVLDGEVAAQLAFALVPLLHVDRRESALVIGFGTGTTARVVSDAGFTHVDVAELSRDIVALADRHFDSVNSHVAARPDVQVHVTDGRNFLMLDPRTYDLVTVEISSIWFAGAGSLYDTEFYRLVKPRLSPRGALQQWIQLHHLATRDHVAILSSVRSVFQSVWLYEIGNQGLLVACDGDCAPAPPMIDRIEATPGLQAALSSVSGGVHGLLRSRVLTPEGVDRFLAAAGATPEKRASFASTDDNLYLEYSTPRGNVRDYQETLFANLAALRAFSPGSETDGTHLARR